MTNPDREELFTPDELAVRLDEWANCLDKSQWDLRSDMRCAAIHLRRLASSYGGEVSRIVEAAQDIVALWDSPKIQGLPRAERNSAIEDSRAALIDAVHELARSSVGSEQGSSNSKVAGSNPAAPANNATEAHQVEQLFCKQSVAGSNPARGTNTTPPADAGMREAFVRVLASLAAAISILERTPKAKKAVASDKMFDTMLDDYRKALEAGRKALTAPGATTKSDGGAKAGSSPILASKEDQRSDTHGMMPVGDNAANIGSTGVGPSDPSSTRSDVTVDDLVDVMIDAGLLFDDEHEAARALLDTYKIGAK